MKPLTVDAIAAFIRAAGLRARVRGRGDTVVRGLSTDSRTVQPGQLFLALPGERFDGHAFVEAALQRGAVAVVADPARLRAAGLGSGPGLPFDGSVGEVSSHPHGDGGVPLIEVEDTLRALQAIAGGYVRSLGVTVVGVTGSTGKTTTKDLLAAMLGAWQPTVKSRGNQNNDIGVPLTLLQAEPDTRFVVVEMGMRGRGELARLCAVARPRVGLITNIGPVHVERLGSVAAVAEAKAELLDALPPTGVAVLNGDDEWSRQIAHRSAAPVVWFGRGPEATLRLLAVHGQGLDPLALEVLIQWPPGSAGQGAGGPRTESLRVPIPGRHNALNALGAAAAALALGCPWSAIAAGAARVEGQRTAMRMEVQRWGDVVVINDAYNASPPSMSAALQALAETGGRRKVAVLGDMLELGSYAPEAHRRLGQWAAEAGVELVIAVGQWAATVVEAARQAGISGAGLLAVPDAAAAARAAVERIRPGDVCLIKGSRGVGLEKVAAALAAFLSPAPAAEGEAR